jgi:hypothetical protein
MNASGRNLSGPLSRLAIGFSLYFWVYISEVIYRCTLFAVRKAYPGGPVVFRPPGFYDCGF